MAHLVKHGRTLHVAETKILQSGMTSLLDARAALVGVLPVWSAFSKIGRGGGKISRAKALFAIPQNIELAAAGSGELLENLDFAAAVHVAAPQVVAIGRLAGMTELLVESVSLGPLLQSKLTAAAESLFSGAVEAPYQVVATIDLEMDIASIELEPLVHGHPFRGHAGSLAVA